MSTLSRFQTELLQFFYDFVEQAGREPYVQEVALRFGLGEDSARALVLNLKKAGSLSVTKTDEGSSEIPTLWTNSPSATKLPAPGSYPAGPADDRFQENHRTVAFPLNDLGITPNDHMFVLEVSGHSMIGALIGTGDLVVIDGSKTPQHGDVVAALVDNRVTLKTFFNEGEKIFLRAENPAYEDIHPAEELKIQGVMICLLRKPRR